MKRFARYLCLMPLALSACSDPAFDVAARTTGSVTRGAAPAEILFEEGKSHYTNHRYALALEHFRAAFAEVPTSARFANAIAASYDQIGRYDLARTYYQQALALEPHSATTHNNLGYSYLVEGRSADAMEHLARAAELAQSLQERAVIEGNLRLAMTRTRKAVAEQPAPARGPIELVRQPSRTAWVERSRPRESRLVTAPNSSQLNAAEKLMTSAKQALPAIARGGVKLAALASETLSLGPSEPQLLLEMPPIARAPVEAVVRGSLRDILDAGSGTRERPSATATAAASSVTARIEVCNGAGGTRLATRMASYFRDKDVAVVRITNDTSFNNPKTIVFYRPDRIEAARNIAVLLPFTVEFQEESALGTDVKVRLGVDSMAFDRSMQVRAKEKA